MRDLILVLNFDDTASRAVTRKLRSERVCCKIVPRDISLEAVQEQEPLGLLLAGGKTGQLPAGLDSRLLATGTPMLALGDAAGLLLTQLAGSVGDVSLRGSLVPLIYHSSPLMTGVENGERMVACAREMRLGEHLVPLCSFEETVIGFAHDALPLYGLQFQMEQNDPDGSQILKNFAMNVCGCTGWWDEDAFVTRAVEEIRRVAGDGPAVCAMTGGLSSGISALLAYKALDKQLKCIFVDTGLLREREGDDLIAFYRDALGMDIVRVNAQARYLDALRGVDSAEEKRRTILELTRRIFREEEEKLGPVSALIRGTTCGEALSGDVPAPALGNDVPVIEPVRDLFPEEILRISDFLGVPEGLISRRLLPPSGLALRIMGEVTEDRLRVLRKADALFSAELQRSSAAKRLWTYFAALIPLPGNDTESMICLRALQGSEQSAAFAARLPYDVTENVVELILRDQKTVRRVVYDCTPGREGYAE